MNLTTGMYMISRYLVPRFIGGLNYESNEELGGNGHLWTDTNYEENGLIISFCT